MSNTTRKAKPAKSAKEVSLPTPVSDVSGKPTYAELEEKIKQKDVLINSWEKRLHQLATAEEKALDERNKARTLLGEARLANEGLQKEHARIGAYATECEHTIKKLKAENSILITDIKQLREALDKATALADKAQSYNEEQAKTIIGYQKEVGEWRATADRLSTALEAHEARPVGLKGWITTLFSSK